MPYYLLNSYPQEEVGELEQLCLDVGMKEFRCCLPNRQWLVDGEVSLVRFIPSHPFPLLVQTLNNCDYKTPNVNKFFKGVVGLARVDFFYQDVGAKEFLRIDVALL